MTRFQITIESLLKKFNKLDAFKSSNEFYLKLDNKPYMDLVIERQGDIVLVGHYRIQNSDLISDPVLAFIILDSGRWLPLRIEQVLGDTQIAREREDGKLEWWKYKYKDFISFSVMFASNIVHQGWKEAAIKRFKLVNE